MNVANRAASQGSRPRARNEPTAPVSTSPVPALAIPGLPLELTAIRPSGAAIKLLEKSNASFEFTPHWGADMQAEHERYLTEKVFNGPVIVTDYPREIKAFYMHLNDDEKTVAAMDVLLPGIGEIIGGSQREARADVLESRIRDMGLDPVDYAWYLDLRRFGSVPHAGFGLGFERMMLFCSGMQNIRDVIPFPRAPRNADF